MISEMTSTTFSGVSTEEMISNSSTSETNAESLLETTVKAETAVTYETKHNSETTSYSTEHTLPSEDTASGNFDEITSEVTFTEEEYSTTATSTTSSSTTASSTIAPSTTVASTIDCSHCKTHSELSCKPKTYETIDSIDSPCASCAHCQNCNDKIACPFDIVCPCGNRLQPITYSNDTMGCCAVEWNCINDNDSHEMNGMVDTQFICATISMHYNGSNTWHGDSITYTHPETTTVQETTQESTQESTRESTTSVVTSSISTVTSLSLSSSSELFTVDMIDFTTDEASGSFSGQSGTTESKYKKRNHVFNIL